MPRLCIFPVAILQDERVSGLDLRAFAAVSNFAHTDGGGVWASMETMAKVAGMNVRVFRRSIARLESFGWLSREIRRPRTSLLKIAMDFVPPAPASVNADNVGPIGEQSSAGPSGPHFSTQTGPIETGSHETGSNRSGSYRSGSTGPNESDLSDLSGQVNRTDVVTQTPQVAAPLSAPSERNTHATRVAPHEVVQHPATAKAQIVVPVIQGSSAAVLPAAASVGPITPPCDTAGEFDYSAIRTPPMAADAHHVFDLADDEDGDNASDIAPAPLADRDSAPVAQTVMDVLVHGEEGAVEVPKRAIKASRGAKHGRTDGTKFPYFSSALRGQLIDVWKKGVRPLAEGEYGKIFKYFGPFFQLPEAERPVDDPRDDEVIAALREILVARKYAQGGDKFSEPQIAAEKITPVVEILRECQFDAAARMERIDRVLGLRSVHKASHAR